MGETEGQQAPGTAPPAKPPASIPMAALAGAVILVGLVAFALYRRGSVPATPGTTSATPAPVTETGTPIVAHAPFRLTPEASILAERYRCVCGCNDTLSVCTCRNDRGSEEMKQFLQEQVDAGKTVEEIDAAMTGKFGDAALLSNPAPPQTLPSHASGGKMPEGAAAPKK